MRKGEIVGKQKVGKVTMGTRKTYSELFGEFINQLKIKGRAEQTLTSYKYHNKYFLDFLGEDIYCDNITLGIIEDYIVYIKEKKNINNATTINSYIRNISPVIKYGIKKGYILSDFEMPVVKGQETFKEIYTNEELKNLLNKPLKRDFVTIRTWTIIWTFASTGIRARELRELKNKNVDIINRTIIVNSTKNKKARVLPISSSFIEVLEEYMNIRMGQGEEYLFCSVYNSRLAMSSLQKSIKDYCNQRGIEKTSLHLFRHTFITNAVNKNISPLILQRITGHSTLKELNHYYNAKTIDLINVIDEIAPASNKKESCFKKGSKK